MIADAAWWVLWGLVCGSVVGLAVLVAASAYPPAWAVVRRVWPWLRWGVVAAVSVLVAALLSVVGRPRRRRPAPMRPDTTARDHDRADVQRAQAAQAAAESEARTERAVTDDDTATGWDALDQERDALQRAREED